MFEKEAEERYYKNYPVTLNIGEEERFKEATNIWKDGAEFGYNKGKEELTERLDNATEIIGLMKDLFFACWQEKGYKAIQFEQRVNDFLKGQ